MHIKDIWPSLRTMTWKKDSLPWYSKPFLAFRNELYAINKNTGALIEQNDEIINLLHCILAQLIKLNGRHA